MAKNAPEYKELTEFLSNNETFKNMAIKTHNIKLDAWQQLDKAAFPEEHKNKKYLENNSQKIAHNPVTLSANSKMTGKLLQIKGTYQFQEAYLDQKAVLLNFHGDCKLSIMLGNIFYESIKHSNGWSILKIDAKDPDNYELKHEYGIKDLPYTNLIIDGLEVEKMIGYDQSKLTKMLQKASMRY